VAAALEYGPRPPGLEVRHLCGNPLCCSPAHLVYGTRAQNIADMMAHGRGPIGVRNGSAKLTAAQVTELRAPGPIETARAAAARMGVKLETIRKARNGHTYPQVTRG
jgi:hypothetical protein